VAIEIKIREVFQVVAPPLEAVAAKNKPEVSPVTVGDPTYL
jgi:hypothetical protein